MASYEIIGLSDCREFARAERIAHVLEASLPRTNIGIHMRHPDAWRTYITELKESKKLPPVRQWKSPIVWDPDSMRLVGDANDFESEVK